MINLLRRLDRGKEASPGDAAAATAASAVTADVNAGPRWFLAPVLTAVPFALMDLFLRCDGGVGYIVVARKP